MSRRSALVVLALALSLTQPLQGAPPNSNCAWPPDANQPGHHGPLARDAEFAEDLTIRYADACCGPHSGHFEGMAEYARKRDQCMATLFQSVARDHGVSTGQVRGSLSDRPMAFDSAVIVSFAVLYALAAYLIARRLWRLYSRSGDRERGLMMTLYVSTMIGAAGMLLADVWSVAMETIRIGNGHLSYRTARIPWQHHRLVLFVFGVLLFWAVSALRYRAEFPPKRSS
jgi:hypothetical protein